MSDKYIHCRPLFCPDGSFVARYTHNYQHAASYPAFILSGELQLAVPTLLLWVRRVSQAHTGPLTCGHGAGIVDLIGMRISLPKGTQQVRHSMLGRPAGW